MGEIRWHCRETRQRTEKTNIALRSHPTTISWFWQQIKGIAAVGTWMIERCLHVEGTESTVEPGDT